MKRTIIAIPLIVLILIVSVFVYAESITLTVRTADNTKSDTSMLFLNDLITDSVIPDNQTVYSLIFNITGDFFFGDVDLLDVYLFHSVTHSDDYLTANPDGTSLVHFHWYNHMSPPDTWTLHQGTGQWSLVSAYDPYEDMNNFDGLPATISLNFTFGSASQIGDWSIVVIQTNSDSSSQLFEGDDFTIQSFVSLDLPTSEIAFDGLSYKENNLSTTIPLTVLANTAYEVRISALDLTSQDDHSIPLSYNILACNGHYLNTIPSIYFSGDSTAEYDLLVSLAWNDNMVGDTTYTTTISVIVTAV